MRKILRITGWTINIALALATLGAAYGGVVDPTVSVLPAMLAMTFPAWLIVAFLTFVVDLFLNKWMALVPVAAVVLSLGPMLSIMPLNFSHMPADQMARHTTFTLMTYNIHGLREGDRPLATEEECKSGSWLKDEPNRTFNYILDKNPDILFIQEGRYIGVNGLDHVTPNMAARFVRRYRCDAPVDTNDLFTVFPMRRLELPQPGNSGSWYAAVAEIDGHETLLIDVHLESVGLLDNERALFREITDRKVIKDFKQGEMKVTMGEVRHKLVAKLARAFRVRSQQAKMLRHQIDSLGYENVILAGDFNDIPDCYAMRTLAGDDFQNAFKEVGCWPKITYHTDHFWFHIDHVLYKGKMRAVGYEVGKIDTSDHYPVNVTFIWDD